MLFRVVSLLKTKKVYILHTKGYIKTWLRTHRCDSDTQIRTASQKSAVKQEDPAWNLL